MNRVSSSEEKHPLRGARDRHQLTLRELAARMQLGLTTVARWEQGKNVPSRFYAQALADTLGFESGEQVQLLCREWREKQRRGESHAN